MINDNSKISFVIPAYNCANTIVESFNSIINGNFEEGDEIIIVNDASTDKTLKVLNKLKSKYPFINIINNDINKGCPATRNIGIKLAKNPLIFNLDADDVLPVNSVSKLKKYLIESDADVVTFGESHYFTKTIKKITHKRIYKTGRLTLADFLAGIYSPTGNCLYRKEIWGKIGGYWEYGKGLHEYWGFFLKLLANGAKLMVLQDTYYFHRWGLESLFVREFKNSDTSSQMATKMITPFFNLLNEDDVAYIKSEGGSKKWFDGLSNRPIRLRNGEKGVTGYKINLGKESIFKKSIKRILPPAIFNKIKNIYFYIKK